MTPVIVITGPPASGKTTLGKWLSQQLKWPYIGRDDIKETLFDALGWSDREWSKKLGSASYELLYHYLLTHLAVSQPIIIESNFNPTFSTPQFQAYDRQFGICVLEIQCYAEHALLQQRYRQRVEAGTRHPGHVDFVNYETLATSLAQGYDTTPILPTATVLRLDTTHIEENDYILLLTKIQSWLKESCPTEQVSV